LVKHIRSGLLYVIKEIQIKEKSDFRKLMNEVEILIKCGDGHPNVCRYWLCAMYELLAWKTG